MVAVRRNVDGLLDAYWKEIKDISPLPRAKEQELLVLAKAGDHEARQEVLRANLRFVVRVAREFHTPSGPPLIDLVSEGNLGMVEAIQRFDPERGFKFITYAVWWIRQAIFKALASQGRSVRPPVNQINDLYKIEKCMARLSQSLGRAPTFEEVAAEAEISIERVYNALEASNWEVSLDEPLADGDGYTMMDTIVDREPAEEEVEGEGLMQALKRGLHQLDERESRIIMSYFGLGTAQPKTLEAIGEELGITRERVRQLRNRGLEKMRHVCADLAVSSN